MNVGAMKTIIQRFGFDSTDPMVEWINESQNVFYDAFEWPWFRTSVSSTFTVGNENLPSGAPTPDITPKGLFLTETGAKTKPLIYKPLSAWLMDFDYPMTGEPDYYTVVPGSGIKVYPAPAYAYTYTLFYQKLPTQVAIDADVPADWPVRYHYTIARGAVAIGLDADNQEERAAAQLGKFQESIDRAIARYSREQTGVVDKIRNVAGY